ncbi:MAG: hypothetical protein Q8P58_00110 [Candidatus Adlerbacteria bacterium]|nr:hypothetical protein [Candidatus Adlerbacteria bacterium]MDZ4226152.1 hypothetical protein [Patescibacteria group bacterium]
MSYAVYFVAVGEPALNCLSYAYRSLRAAGFTGDVYIMCDRDAVPFPVAQNTWVKKIQDEHLNLDLNSTKPLSFFDVRRLDINNPRNVRNTYTTKKFAICHMKSLAEEYVPLDKYDYVVYLDSDILTAGPMERFEEFVQKHEGAIITSQAEDQPRLGGRGNFSLKKLRRATTTVAANLTTWELIKYWFVQPLCADIICFPTNERGRQFLHEWKAECQKGIDSDQAALQAVLLRDFRDVHILAPYSLFGYGPSHLAYKEHALLEKVNSIFVHFSGAVKDIRALEGYYKKYLVKSNLNQVV